MHPEAPWSGATERPKWSLTPLGFAVGAALLRLVSPCFSEHHYQGANGQRGPEGVKTPHSVYQAALESHALVPLIIYVI